MADDGRRELWVTLEPSTYRGIPWFVESISVSGGRKATEKPILNSSHQVVNDVGQKQRIYQVRGYITAQYRSGRAQAADTLADIIAETEARAERERLSGVTEPGPLNLGASRSQISADYREMRLILTTAFELQGGATLIHPIEGEITDLICKEFSIDESMQEVGIGRVTATFIRETVIATPEPVVGSKEAVRDAADAADAAADTQITEDWSVSTDFVNGVESAAEKLSDVYAKALFVAESVETVTDAMDQFQRDTAQLEADVFMVVGEAVSVSDSVRGVFDSLNGVFSLPAAAFLAMRNGFDFGDLDLDFDFSTPSGSQKKANQDAMNAGVRCSYLTGAYRAALELDYITTDDIAVIEGILEDQHEKIVDGDGANDCMKDSLTVLRETFFAFLAAARLNARALVEQDVVSMTPRILAYLLYEDDEDMATLAGLNDVQTYELISGAVTVLSA